MLVFEGFFPSVAFDLGYQIGNIGAIAILITTVVIASIFTSREIHDIEDEVKAVTIVLIVGVVIAFCWAIVWPLLSLVIPIIIVMILRRIVLKVRGAYFYLRYDRW